jgi:MFS family permease
MSPFHQIIRYDKAMTAEQQQRSVRMLRTLLAPQFTLRHLFTYLVFLALSSVSLLVFLNSSISFIITDILNIHKNVGRAVGDLGFADELVVLIAAPAWGFISDHVAKRIVVGLGFGFMAVGLCGMVGVHEGNPNWWAILLVSRCLFAVGAAATSV